MERPGALLDSFAAEYSFARSLPVLVSAVRDSSAPAPAAVLVSAVWDSFAPAGSAADLAGQNGSGRRREPAAEARSCTHSPASFETTTVLLLKERGRGQDLRGSALNPSARRSRPRGPCAVA